MLTIEKETVTLDPDDPFDAALIPIVQTNRKKRKDYALDGDAFSSFTDTSSLMAMDGFEAREAAYFNMLQKVVRLKSLRANGRFDDPQNEAVEDTFLDLAVYGVITYGIILRAKPYDNGVHIRRTDEKFDDFDPLDALDRMNAAEQYAEATGAEPEVSVRTMIQRIYDTPILPAIEALTKAVEKLAAKK